MRLELTSRPTIVVTTTDGFRVQPPHLMLTYPRWCDAAASDHRFFWFRIVQTQHQMLLAELLAVQYQRFFGPLNCVQEVHDEQTQGQCDECAIESDRQMPRGLVKKTLSITVLHTGHAHTAGQSAHCAEEPDR